MWAVYVTGAVGWCLLVITMLARDEAMASRHPVAAWVLAALVSAAIWPVMVVWSLGFAALRLWHRRA